ncbi:MAG: glycosyltransferase family 4 protein [Candidatus Woesearchaeota archaeon]
MKVLIINSRYFLSAGPERYMFGLIKLLEKHGHTVIPFSLKCSKNEKAVYEKYFANPIGGLDEVYFEDFNKWDLKTDFQLLDRQFYSFHVKRKLKELIVKEKPDIAYILHHVNRLSPSIIDACKESNLPIVMRLSDFSLVCPENHLLRDGVPCEECITKSLFSAVRHKCVKDSYIASIVKTCAMKFHRVTGIYDKVDYVISPSRFTIGKIEHLLKKKIVHIPTMTEMHHKQSSKKSGEYILFVGRVEPEKGVMWAINALENDNYNFKIVGPSHSGYDSTLKEYVKKHKLKNIEFLGAKKGSELKELYSNARFVLLPNLWYENMPNVALESMSYGKPIITSDLGSMKEIVADGVTGFLVKPNDVEALREKIRLLFNDTKLCTRMGNAAVVEANTKYDPEKHYERLMKVFNQAIRSARGTHEN